MLFQQLLFPLIDALNQNNTFQLTRDQIIEHYHYHKEGWLAPGISYTITIPLLNFTSDLDHEATIGTNLKIAPLTAEEKSQIWDQDLRINPTASTNIIQFSPFSSTRFKLTGTRIQKRDRSYGYNGSESINEELTNILTALRLAYNGQIGAPVIIERCQVRSVWLPLIVGSGTSDYNVNQYGKEYSLDESALPTIISLFGVLQSLKKQKKPSGLEVALRRFNQAYGRDNQEDSIIDLTVALDSCLNAGINDELRFRFALRGAALLAGKKNTRETYAFLLAMYDARSLIVHEGKLLADLKKYTDKVPSGRQPEEFPQACEDVVRDILYQYVTRLKDGQTLIDFNKELENHIVDKLVP